MNNQILAEENGNVLYVENGEVKLTLATETRSRVIARIQTDCLLLIRDREKHLHRKSQSYGINYMMLKMLPQFRTIKIRDEYGEFSVPVEVVKQAKPMYFKFSKDGNAYELQYFLKLDTMTSPPPTSPSGEAFGRQGGLFE